MKQTEILIYCQRALRFALPAGAVWLVGHLLWQLLRRKKPQPGRECLLLAFVVYMASLLQITVWRAGVDWQGVFAGKGGTQQLQLTLLHTTLKAWRRNKQMFFYHSGGNVAWFIPFGIMVPGVRRRWNFAETLLLGFLPSVGIEALRYFLRTGVTDIDDVLLNSLGAALGCLLILLTRLLSGNGRRKG